MTSSELPQFDACQHSLFLTLTPAVLPICHLLHQSPDFIVTQIIWECFSLCGMCVLVPGNPTQSRGEQTALPDSRRSPLHFSRPPRGEEIHIQISLHSVRPSPLPDILTPVSPARPLASTLQTVALHHFILPLDLFEGSARQSWFLTHFPSMFLGCQSTFGHSLHLFLNI